MALSLTQLPAYSSFPALCKSTSIQPRQHITFRIKPKPTIIQKKQQRSHFLLLTKATEAGNSSNTESASGETEPPAAPPQQQNEESKSAYEPESGDEISQLGSEIKRVMAMEEREKGKDDGNGFWGGVAEEIREIEWPAFNKVLATTGVVIGVIAGSSVVLLTVNAVLAELSDRVFVGKGVQDFFS